MDWGRRRVVLEGEVWCRVGFGVASIFGGAVLVGAVLPFVCVTLSVSTVCVLVMAVSSCRCRCLACRWCCGGCKVLVSRSDVFSSVSTPPIRMRPST